MYNEIRDSICSRYIRYYERNGFKQITPYPIRVHNDPSICFAACTICHFKEDFFNNTAYRDYCVVQPALRTNTYSDINSASPLKFTAGITMLGVFESIKTEDPTKILVNHFILQAGFLRSCITKDSDIKVLAPIGFRKFFSGDALVKLSEMRVEIQWRTDDFLWEYGHESLKGQGTEWYIERNGRSYEFGNVIFVYRDNGIIGVEAGGSVELLLQSITEAPHKIYTNIYMNEDFCYLLERDMNVWVKIFDCIDVLYHVIRCYYTEPRFPVKLYVVLEEYVKALRCLIIISRMTQEEMNRIYSEFEKYYAGCKALYGEQAGDYLTFVRDLNKIMDEYWDPKFAYADYRKIDISKKKNYSELERYAFECIEKMEK